MTPEPVSVILWAGAFVAWCVALATGYLCFLYAWEVTKRSSTPDKPEPLPGEGGVTGERQPPPAVPAQRPPGTTVKRFPT